MRAITELQLPEGTGDSLPADPNCPSPLNLVLDLFWTAAMVRHEQSLAEQAARRRHGGSARDAPRRRALSPSAQRTRFVGARSSAKEIDPDQCDRSSNRPEQHPCFSVAIASPRQQSAGRGKGQQRDRGLAEQRQDQELPPHARNYRSPIDCGQSVRRQDDNFLLASLISGHRQPQERVEEWRAYRFSSP